MADGSVVFADSNASRIRKVAPDGTITTIAGNGRCSLVVPLGDGGPAVDAAVCAPASVAAAPDGSIYIADRTHHRVRKIDPAGIITTDTCDPVNGVQHAAVADGFRITARRMPCNSGRDDVASLRVSGVTEACVSEVCAHGRSARMQLAG